jgi:Arc/MetJ family transcription regulator
MTRAVINVDDDLLAWAAEILGATQKTETVNTALRYGVAAAARRRFLDGARQGAFVSLTDPDERAEAWR